MPHGEPLPRRPQLTIVIPALDEEEAIGETIARCLAAREEIRRSAGVGEIQVIVVSDGSTDRTAEIAKSYTEIDVIEFIENQGYGAAIKAGWERGGGDLLSFLDADGTCDPSWFAPMCRRIVDGGDDVVLGCRMGPGSKMPHVRRLGNTLFAFLLGRLAKKPVRDTSSGMRVIRRSALPRLLPLPDGLHFTPAMSAVALMDDDLVLSEIDMPYAERVGQSKLHVLRDGLRFMEVIVAAAAYVKASRLTVPVMFLLSLAAALLMIDPTLFYVRNAYLEEWMFYRFSFAGMLGSLVVTLLCGTIIVEHAVALTLMRYERMRRHARGLWRYENLRIIAVIGTLAWLAGALLNLEGIEELLDSGHVTLHWSRVMVGLFFSVNLAQILAALSAVKILRALHRRQFFLRSHEGRVENEGP